MGVITSGPMHQFPGSPRRGLSGAPTRHRLASSWVLPATKRHLFAEGVAAGWYAVGPWGPGVYILPER